MTWYVAVPIYFNLGSLDLEILVIQDGYIRFSNIFVMDIENVVFNDSVYMLGVI